MVPMSFPTPRRAFALRTAAALLALQLFCVPATAELYKYETADGEVLITSEKRADLRLIEIISGGSKIKRKSQSSSGKKTTSNKKTVAGNHAQDPQNEVPRNARETAFDDIVREAAAAYDVPFGFIKAVIRVESNFNPNALSHAGAMGLMQLMPRTAASLNVTNAFDPRQNVYGGAKFLRILIDRYDGDINLILAAYNAGDAAVARYNGIPYPQTRGYVSKVYRWYQVYSAAEGEE